jgi:hypothetical protein
LSPSSVAVVNGNSVETSENIGTSLNSLGSHLKPPALVDDPAEAAANNVNDSVVKQVTSDPKGILHDALDSAEMARINSITPTVFLMME